MDAEEVVNEAERYYGLLARDSAPHDIRHLDGDFFHSIIVDLGRKDATLPDSVTLLYSDVHGEHILLALPFEAMNKLSHFWQLRREARRNARSKEEVA